MLNKTSRAYRIAVTTTAFALAIFTTTVTAQNVDRQKISAEIESLTMADEFKGPERERLQNLPKESIPLFLEKFLRANPPGEQSRLLGMLVIKFKQFQSHLTAQESAVIVDAIVLKCEASNGVALQEQLTTLETIKDPKIDEMARRLSQSNDPVVKSAANRYLQNRTAGPSN